MDISNANWIILGKSGSGKSTLFQFFNDMGYSCLSCSALLRQAIKSNATYAKMIEEAANYASPISDSIVFEVIEQELNSKLVGPFVLESFPVNLAQFSFLVKKLKTFNRLHVTHFVHLDIAEELLLSRVQHRLTCSSCFTVYNTIQFPPKTPETCDRCGHSLFQRQQDHIDKMKRRFESFQRETGPVLSAIQDSRYSLTTLKCENDIVLFKQMIVCLHDRVLCKK